MAAGLRCWRGLVVAGIVAVPLLAIAQIAGRSVWDGAYTADQAERGKVVYEEQCAFCHLSDLRGQGFAPSLVEDTFKGRWQDGNLGDLFTIVQATMPQDKPASLQERQYADIVAFLLRSNSYPAGQQELRPDPTALRNVTFKRPDTK